LDLSLFLGVLGVVLTIIFFVVCYRQTIGARRERARAANQALVDTIFRRLALEENFSLPRSEVAKVISGWAINARIKSSDVHSLQELEDLLAARALESDYVAEAQRQTISSRIVKMFSEEKNPIFIEKTIVESGKFKPEVFLAIASGLMSMAAAILASFFLPERAGTTARAFLENSVIPATGLIVLTVVTILFYTRVRDISRPTSDEPFLTRTNAIGLERAFFSAARRRNKTLKPSSDQRYDFTFESDDGLVGIEIKEDVNKISRIQLNRIMARLRAAVDSGTIAKAIIGSGMPPNERVVIMSDEKVSVRYIPELFSLISQRPQAEDES